MYYVEELVECIHSAYVYPQGENRYRAPRNSFSGEWGTSLGSVLVCLNFYNPADDSRSETDSSCTQPSWYPFFREFP